MQYQKLTPVKLAHFIFPKVLTQDTLFSWQTPPPIRERDYPVNVDLKQLINVNLGCTWSNQRQCQVLPLAYALYEDIQTSIDNMLAGRTQLLKSWQTHHIPIHVAIQCQPFWQKATMDVQCTIDFQQHHLKQKDDWNVPLQQLLQHMPPLKINLRQIPVHFVKIIPKTNQQRCFLALDLTDDNAINKLLMQVINEFSWIINHWLEQADILTRYVQVYRLCPHMEYRLQKLYHQYVTQLMMYRTLLDYQKQPQLPVFHYYSLSQINLALDEQVPVKKQMANIQKSLNKAYWQYIGQLVIFKYNFQDVFKHCEITSDMQYEAGLIFQHYQQQFQASIAQNLVAYNKYYDLLVQTAQASKAHKALLQAQVRQKWYQAHHDYRGQKRLHQFLADDFTTYLYQNLEAYLQNDDFTFFHFHIQFFCGNYQLTVPYCPRVTSRPVLLKQNHYSLKSLN